MVFQTTLSGTNYFKRPPLYHNREGGKKRGKEEEKISPISTSLKLSTQELIIEPWRELGCLLAEARHRSIYLQKSIFQTVLFQSVFHTNGNKKELLDPV